MYYHITSVVLPSNSKRAALFDLSGSIVLPQKKQNSTLPRSLLFAPKDDKDGEELEELKEVWPQSPHTEVATVGRRLPDYGTRSSWDRVILSGCFDNQRRRV